MRTIRPLGDNLLLGPVRRVPQAGEIIIPDNARYQGEHDREYWVIAVGPRVTDIKPKDRVVLTKGHQDLIYLPGDPQMRGLISQHAVVAIFPS